MKHLWWKALGVAMLLFAAIVSLRVPLAPAIVHVSIDRIAPGPVEFDLIGYNTRFTADATPQVWLANYDQQLCARSVHVLDASHLHVACDIPPGLHAEQTDVALRTSEGVILMARDALWTEGIGIGATSAPCVANGTVAAKPFQFPMRAILVETIRNLNWHVPMWFTMMVLMSISLFYSIRGLNSGSLDDDMAADMAARIGLFFCLLGLATGSIWARTTWGDWWTTDIKLNGAAVTGLIYMAYLVLRGSVPESHKRARLAAIYNVFAFALLILFLWVLPRMGANDSLHPGNGGNPAFNSYDLDNALRVVFYPACIGWICMGLWMYTLRLRIARLRTNTDL